MTASVRRTPGGTRRYAGEGEWVGTPLKIEAQFSRAYGRITLTVDGAPSALGADARLEACDETNAPMRCLGMDPQTDGVTYLFNGTARTRDLVLSYPRRRDRVSPSSFPPSNDRQKRPEAGAFQPPGFFVQRKPPLGAGVPESL